MKPIKFNMIVNNTVIRTIEDLQAQFNIDDVYELYKKGILQKWLRLKNEEKLAADLDAIASTDLKEVISTILRLFEYDEESIDLCAYGYLYQQEYKEAVKAFNVKATDYTNILKEYHEGYDCLKEKLSNPSLFTEDYPDILDDSEAANTVEFMQAYDEQKSKEFQLIKATVNEIAMRYLELFKLDMDTFFEYYNVENPLVIMACLMNKQLAKLLLEDEDISTTLNIRCSEQLVEELNPVVKTYHGNTSGMWKYLGEKEKSYLVIRITGKCRVGEQEKVDQDYDSDAINGEYKLLKGLLFKSSDASQKVSYLEV